MTQLVADEQEALKQLVSDCCPGLSANTPSSSSSSEGVSGWCSSVGHAVTYDLRQWYADICHVAPNVCDSEGHLRRLVLPPYALRCKEFPKVRCMADLLAVVYAGAISHAPNGRIPSHWLGSAQHAGVKVVTLPQTTGEPSRAPRFYSMLLAYPSCAHHAKASIANIRVYTTCVV
jgi:hypothetical protein